MTPIIILVVIMSLVAIGAYQLVINKHYWGPKGPPKKIIAKDQEVREERLDEK